jgi:hypothetical protein
MDNLTMFLWMVEIFATPVAILVAVIYLGRILKSGMYVKEKS